MAKLENMDITAITYDRPREKLQLKGAQALSSGELLQILIGSGTAQTPVAKIAKKTLKSLSRYGNSVTFEQLLAIPGLGPARACLLIAAFELASRYPSSNRQFLLDSDEKILSMVSELRTSKLPKLVYITLDGARRLIAKRTLLIGEQHPSIILRRVFTDVMGDDAAALILAVGSTSQPLDPSMFDLTLARDVRAMAQLFMVTIKEQLLVNSTDHKSLRSESW